MYEQRKAQRPPETLWRRWVNRPQQVWLRRAFFQIHLWAGVIVGLYIIAIGVSGSILVFKEELMPRPDVDVPWVDTRACSPEGLVSIADRINEQYPEKYVFLTACPSEFQRFYLMTMRDKPKPRVEGEAPARGFRAEHGEEVAVYAHPLTGEIVGTADRESSWVHWMQDFHYNLQLGRGGRFWNGVGGAVLMALTITGIMLWWPGIRKWTRALKVDLSRSWKRINWDLHSAAGLWTILFTAVWAFTGMYFTWPEVINWPANAVSSVETAHYPGERMRELRDRPAAPPGGFDLMAVLRESQEISPDAALEGYFYGGGEKPIFTVYMAHGRVGDYANTDFLYFDQHSGEHLHTWRRGRNQTLGDWMVGLMIPLHFGTSWGPVVKWTWCILGLALPLLTITGFIMYWNRYLGGKWRALRYGKHPRVARSAVVGAE